MKRLVYHMMIGLLTLPLAVAAQDEKEESAFEPKEDKTQTDQEAYQPPNDGKRFHKVVLVPYRPVMHLSDADPEIVMNTGLPLDLIHRRMRGELSATVNHYMKKLYPLKDLLLEEIDEESEDLRRIYNSIGYKMEDTKPTYLGEEAQEKKKVPLLNKLKIGRGVVDESAESTLDDGNTYLKTDDKDQQYLASNIGNDKLLPYLTNKYQADMFVFINQLEIKTNYASCLDLARKIYQREIKVHFTVFDKDGKKIMGDVAVAVFPSSSNDIGQITSKTYPLIAEYMAKSIPQPGETIQEEKEAHDKMIGKWQKKINRKTSRQN